MASNKWMLFDRIYQQGLYSDFVEFAIYMRLKKGYSFFNSALILLQRPGALYVESEEVWANKYERHLLPEATPIVIMQPFGPINFVYDFADTYGDQVPYYMRNSFVLPKSDPQIGKWLTKLIYIVNQLGIYYGEKDYGSRQGGQVEYLENAMKIKVYDEKKEIEISTHLAITVNKHTQDEEKATAILHEIGHILCGHLPVDKTNQRLKVPDRAGEDLCKEQKEFEAEKVCELVCKTMGLYYDNKEYLNGYLVNESEPYFSMRLVVEASDKFMKTMKIY